MIVRILAASLASLAFAAPALAKPPVTAFTPIAEIHDMQISPDGKRVAWVQDTADGEAVVERNLETGKIRSIIRAADRRIDGLRYLTDNFLHLVAFKPVYDATDKDAYNIGTAHIFDFARETSYRFDAYGRILAVNADGKTVYMLGRGGVVGIQMETGNVASAGMARGWEDDFIVSPAGKLVAAQDINRETGNNRIFAASGLDRRVLFQEEPKPAEVHLLGVLSDGGAIVVQDRRDGAHVARTLTLADGVMSEPLFNGAEIVKPVRDRTGAIVGFEMAGVYPRYEFFDAALATDVRSIRASFPGQAVTLVNWSDDKSRLLVSVEGGIEPGRYAIFDRTARKLTAVMQTRPSVPKEDMGEVISIEYPARDGRKIAAVITWPARLPADQRKSLPLVVLPHDHAQDASSSVGFDWIAQFIANEGYAVLQPNYRGSAGSTDLRTAGYEEFGRRMQHDITDGVHALAEMGWVDPDRVCIAGEGWGGYLALVGAAITPHRYRCAAAINGITDLPDFLKKRSEGDQRYNDYLGRWKNLLGDPERNLDNLERYSPVNLARQIAAPVLLIHADNNWYSPDRQSRKMELALETAEKPVDYILIPRENHYLIRQESRERVLNELAKLFAANLTPRPPQPKPAD